MGIQGIPIYAETRRNVYGYAIIVRRSGDFPKLPESTWGMCDIYTRRDEDVRDGADKMTLELAV